jgi:hypothetical protein
VSDFVLIFVSLCFQYNSIEWKVQHFYESCKTLEYIEADREKPLMKIINNLGGWDVLRSFNLYNWDPHRVLRNREYIFNRRQCKYLFKRHLPMVFSLV